VGLKDHRPVQAEMQCFVAEVAPHFQGQHLGLAAEERGRQGRGMLGISVLLFG
jgi:hypothetical protein